MDPTRYYQQQQEAKRLQNRISSFLEDFRVGTLLSGSNIRKLRGATPLAVFTAIFTLPFVGANFSRGIAGNPGLGFRKDAAYEFLKNPRYNWRKFLLSLVTVVVRFMDVLTSEQREKVLIIDDSLYDRSRSKVVERGEFPAARLHPVLVRQDGQTAPGHHQGGGQALLRLQAQDGSHDQVHPAPGNHGETGPGAGHPGRLPAHG